jgi:signal peptidase
MFVTKGDNNEVTDEVLYPGDRTSVSRQEIRGFVRGFLPLLGWLVIAVQEIVWVKYLVCAFVLVAACLGI